MPPKAAASALRIRDAAARDVKAIHAIYAHHVLHGLGSFEEAPPSRAEIRRRYDAVRLAGLPYLVAELPGGKIAGYAYATLYRTRSGYRYTLEDSVYVDAALSGRGVGRALLTELIARCEALGFRQLVAVIGDSANHGSIRLHAALGFVHDGVLRSVGFKFGRWVDTVLMRRPLGAGDSRLP